MAKTYISSGAVLIAGGGVLYSGILAITTYGGRGTLSSFWSLGFGQINTAEIVNWGQQNTVCPLPESKPFELANVSHRVQ